MSDEQVALLEARMKGWNTLLQTCFGGLRDIVVAAGVIWTAIATSTTQGKVDLAAQAAASTNAITTKWWADKTGEPHDMAKAEQAAARLDTVAEKIP